MGWLMCLLVLAPSCLVKEGEGGQLEDGGWKCGEELYPLIWVCDGVEQCDDDSDEGTGEGEGCNLFPESGCPSSRGREHFRCKRTGECFQSKGEAEQCETSTSPPNRECTVGEGGDEGWKCRDGRCIELRQVCDNSVHCTDGTDESHEPHSGCNRFPNSANCSSWGGEEYSRCEAYPEDKVVCTNMPYNLTDPESCRICLDPNHRRCDNGLCINSTLFRNGVPDCMDGSDEIQLDLRLPYVIIITVVVVISGILVSFACRALGKKNVRSCFHCPLCSSSKRRHLKRYTSVNQTQGAAPGDQVDCGVEDDSDLLYPDNDLPMELIRLLDDKSSNWERERRDSVSTRILQSHYIPTSLKPEVMLEAKRLYVLVHTDPIQYHHLYKYLVNRSGTVQELAKVTDLLFSWEKEMHGMNKQEVIKCWRLHLGATQLMLQVTNSVTDEQSLASKWKTTLYPLKQMIRQIRRKAFQVKPREDSVLHKLLNLASTTVFPFVEASLFYFEQIKNVVFVHIFWTALLDLSHDRPLDHPFEFSLVLFMIIGISFTQLLFLVYSFYFAADIFEVSHEKACKKPHSRISILFQVVSVLFSPFIPCYVLANHVYYNSKLYLTRRHLQTLNDIADDLPDEEDQGKGGGDQPSRMSAKERIDLYKNICKLETKSLFFRKVYSYFRVTSAILESSTVLVSLVLLVFVTGRSNRPIRLIIGVEHRLYTFFGIQDTPGGGGSLLSELNLMRDVVITGSLLYSLFILLSAMVKYWYQAKNLSVSMSGQVCLGVYLLCLGLNRLTTCVSLFATTQPLPNKGFDSGAKEPNVTLEVAMILFLLLLVLRLGLVYFYKSKYSRSWGLQYVTESGREVPDRLDHWVNLLANTVVVVPFMVQTCPVAVLKKIQKNFKFTPEKEQAKRDSLRRKTSLLRVVSQVDDAGRSADVVQSVAGVVMPNMNFFTGPILYEELRAKIRAMWWDDPTVKLEVVKIRNKLDADKGFKVRLGSMDKETVDRNIEITLKHLEYIGMVNSPLLHPVQTKREFFWLYLFVLVENLLALAIELGNGGVWTSQGHYYSWDVRLLSFTLSLVFLSAYYKRYHITSSLINPFSQRCGGWLLDLPVWLCCKEERNISASPNEDVMEQWMSKDEPDSKKSELTRTIETQTSFSPFSAFPPCTTPPPLPPREMTIFPPSTERSLVLSPQRERFTLVPTPKGPPERIALVKSTVDTAAAPLLITNHYLILDMGNKESGRGQLDSLISRGEQEDRLEPTVTGNREEDRLLTDSAASVTSDVCGNNSDDPSHNTPKTDDIAISDTKPGVPCDISDNLTNTSNNVSCKLTDTSSAVSGTSTETDTSYLEDLNTVSGKCTNTQGILSDQPSNIQSSVSGDSTTTSGKHNITPTNVSDEPINNTPTKNLATPSSGLSTASAKSNNTVNTVPAEPSTASAIPNNTVNTVPAEPDNNLTNVSAKSKPGDTSTPVSETEVDISSVAVSESKVYTSDNGLRVCYSAGAESYTLSVRGTSQIEVGGTDLDNGTATNRETKI